MTGTTQTMTEKIGDVIRAIPGVKPFIEQAQRDTAAREHAERVQIASDIKRIEAAELDAIRQHERRIAPITTKIAQLEKALTAARDEWTGMERERHDGGFATSQRLDRLRGRLRAPVAQREAIQIFVSEMRVVAESWRLQIDEVTELCIDGKWRQQWSNGASTRAAHEAFGDICRAARALENEALSDIELQARFETLRHQMPAIETRPAQYCR